MNRDLEEMSLDDIFSDAVTFNEEDEQSGAVPSGSRRKFPLDRHRAALHDPNYYMYRPPLKEAKPDTPPIKSEPPPNFLGVRRTIARNAGMLRYALGEHIPALMRKVEIDNFAGCNGGCGTGEGRINLGDELKELAKQHHVSGDKKPDYFRILSYISELLAGSLKMILKADHALQYLAGENFDSRSPTGRLPSGRKVASLSGVSSRSGTPKSIPTPPVPCPSELEIAGDIDQLLTWLSESAKTLDQVEPLSGLQQAVPSVPADLFDAFLTETLTESEGVQPLERLAPVDVSCRASTSSSVSDSPSSHAGSPTGVTISIPDRQNQNEGTTVVHAVEEPSKEGPSGSVAVDQISNKPSKLPDTPPAAKASSKKPAVVLEAPKDVGEAVQPSTKAKEAVEAPKKNSSAKVTQPAPPPPNPEVAPSSSKAVAPTPSKLKVVSTTATALAKSPAQPSPKESVPQPKAKEIPPVPSFSSGESPKPVKNKPAVAAGPPRASISMPAVRATSGMNRKREKSPVSDDGKPPAKFIPATPLGSSSHGSVGRRASARQADQQSHLVITSTSRNTESVCIIVSSEVPEEVKREIEKLSFRELGWKVSRCCSSAINHGMTHYVVCTPDRHLRGHRGRAVCPKRSLSLLKAIVMEKWIVTYDWLFMCAKNSVKVPEVSYEIRGTEETVSGMEGGPKRARENEKGNLFADCTFVFDGSVEGVWLELVDLVETAGAKCIPKMTPAAGTRGKPRAPLKHAPEGSEIFQVRCFHVRDVKSEEGGEAQQPSQPNTAAAGDNSGPTPAVRMNVTLQWVLDCMDAFRILPAPLGSKYRW
ncbi:hypothetical protein RvY_07372-2 [Ramazzottius varieornatus]|uniref:BRCT domain-containing protein n=1 Tax=Ramazzottius varieornatus TaxID=947166 RepID=A0A1D1VAC6_RAMVA|nr:hypothetical protein RvY_07372-2 [Ramazzottius varieornatus]